MTSGLAISPIKESNNNRTKNTLAAASVGAGIGAIGGALTYSPFKGDEIKDSFVKSALTKGNFGMYSAGKTASQSKDLYNMPVDEAKNYLKQSMAVQSAKIASAEKSLGSVIEDKSLLKKAKEVAKGDSESINNFIKENSESLPKGAAGKLKEIAGRKTNINNIGKTIESGSDKEIVAQAGKFASNASDFYKGTKTTVSNCFENGKLKKLPENADDAAKETFKTLKSALTTQKVKTAAIAAAVVGAVAGTIAFIRSGKKQSAADELEKKSMNQTI